MSRLDGVGSCSCHGLIAEGRYCVSLVDDGGRLTKANVKSVVASQFMMEPTTGPMKEALLKGPYRGLGGSGIVDGDRLA